MKKKSFLILLLILMLVLPVRAACAKTGGTSANLPAASANNTAGSTEQKGQITFIDDAKRSVVLPASLARIAPSGQMAQIVLLALAPEMLVGISNAWSASAQKYFDPKYYNLPVLGQFYGTKNLDLEQVAKASPQVIIDIGEAKSTIVQDMDAITKQVNIPLCILTLPLIQWGDAYRKMGKLLGKESQAEVLAQYCEQTYKRTQDIMESVGDKNKVKILYCQGNDGLNVLAKGSFHAEVLDLVGNNAAVVQNPSGKGTGNPVDMEQIVLWDPDLILFAPGSYYSQAGTDPAWSN